MTATIDILVEFCRWLRREKGIFTIPRDVLELKGLAIEFAAHDIKSDCEDEEPAEVVGKSELETSDSAEFYHGG